MNIKVGDIVRFLEDINFIYTVSSVEGKDKVVTGLSEFKKPQGLLQLEPHMGWWKFDTFTIVKRKIIKDPRPPWF